jgi:hypothetical protein
MQDMFATNNGQKIQLNVSFLCHWEFDPKSDVQYCRPAGDTGLMELHLKDLKALQTS